MKHSTTNTAKIFIVGINTCCTDDRNVVKHTTINPALTILTKVKGMTKLFLAFKLFAMMGD